MAATQDKDSRIRGAGPEKSELPGEIGMEWIAANGEAIAAALGVALSLVTLVATAVWAVHRVTYLVGTWVGRVDTRLDGVERSVGELKSSVDQVHERMDSHLEASLARRQPATGT